MFWNSCRRGTICGTTFNIDEDGCVAFLIKAYSSSCPLSSFWRFSLFFFRVPTHLTHLIVWDVSGSWAWYWRKTWYWAIRAWTKEIRNKAISVLHESWWCICLTKILRFIVVVHKCSMILLFAHTCRMIIYSKRKLLTQLRLLKDKFDDSRENVRVSQLKHRLNAQRHKDKTPCQRRRTPIDLL